MKYRYINSKEVYTIYTYTYFALLVGLCNTIEESDFVITGHQRSALGIHSYADRQYTNHNQGSHGCLKV